MSTRRRPSLQSIPSTSIGILTHYISCFVFTALSYLIPFSLVYIGALVHALSAPLNRSFCYKSSSANFQPPNWSKCTRSSLPPNGTLHFTTTVIFLLWPALKNCNPPHTAYHPVGSQSHHQACNPTFVLTVRWYSLPCQAQRRPCQAPIQRPPCCTRGAATTPAHGLRILQQWNG